MPLGMKFKTNFTITKIEERNDMNDLSLVYASASRRRRTYAVDVTPSMSIRSSASRRRVALQFTARPLGGCGGVFVWFQGVIAEALLFLPVTVNNTTVAMATEQSGAAVFGVGAHQYWGTNAYFANVEAQATEKTWLKNHCKVQSNNTTHTHLTIYIYIHI